MDTITKYKATFSKEEQELLGHIFSRPGKELVDRKAIEESGSWNEKVILRLHDWTRGYLFGVRIGKGALRRKVRYANNASQS